jgi:hypothetical protein
MWEAQYFHHEHPRTLITSGVLKAMGATEGEAEDPAANQNLQAEEGAVVEPE